MERERIITRSTTYSCNLAASRAESLRINEDMEKVVRVSVSLTHVMCATGKIAIWSSP